MKNYNCAAVVVVAGKATIESGTPSSKISFALPQFETGFISARWRVFNINKV